MQNQGRPMRLRRTSGMKFPMRIVQDMNRMNSYDHAQVRALRAVWKPHAPPAERRLLDLEREATGRKRACRVWNFDYPNLSEKGKGLEALLKGDEICPRMFRVVYFTPDSFQFVHPTVVTVSGLARESDRKIWYERLRS